LADDASILDNPGPPLFEFPYRWETANALARAMRRNDHWVWKYLYGLANQVLDKDRNATRIFDELGQIPDFAPFYVARAQFLNTARGDDPEPDLRTAVALEPESRLYHVYFIRHLQEKEDWEGALAALQEARRRFPNDFNLDLLQAKALINVGLGAEAAEILASTHVLPSEGARESHQLWEQAHIVAAMDAYDRGDPQLAKEHLMKALDWPEHLGQGRPYQPEERLIHFLLARVENVLGNREASRRADEAFLAAAGELKPPLHQLDILALGALRSLDRAEEAEALDSEYRSEFQALIQGLTGDTEGRLIRRALGLGIEGE
jgi:predicted Zn-dependent protease